MFHGCDEPSHWVALAPEMVWLDDDRPGGLIAQALGGQVRVSGHGQRVEGEGGVAGNPVLTEHQSRLVRVAFL